MCMWIYVDEVLAESESVNVIVWWAERSHTKHLWDPFTFNEVTYKDANLQKDLEKVEASKLNHVLHVHSSTLKQNNKNPDVDPSPLITHTHTEWLLSVALHS